MCETSVLLFQCATHDAGCAREHLLGGAHNAPGEGGHQPGDGAGGVRGQAEAGEGRPQRSDPGPGS